MTPHCLKDFSSQGVHLKAVKSVSRMDFHSGPSLPAIRKSSTWAPIIPMCSPFLLLKVQTQGSAAACTPPSSWSTLSTCAYHSRGAVVRPYTDFRSLKTRSPGGKSIASASSCGAKAYLHFCRGLPWRKAAVTSPFLSFQSFCTTTWRSNCFERLVRVGAEVCSVPKWGSWNPNTTKRALHFLVPSSFFFQVKTNLIFIMSSGGTTSPCLNFSQTCSLRNSLISLPFAVLISSFSSGFNFFSVISTLFFQSEVTTKASGFFKNFLIWCSSSRIGNAISMTLSGHSSLVKNAFSMPLPTSRAKSPAFSSSLVIPGCLVHSLFRGPSLIICRFLLRRTCSGVSLTPKVGGSLGGPSSLSSDSNSMSVSDGTCCPSFCGSSSSIASSSGCCSSATFRYWPKIRFLEMFSKVHGRACCRTCSECSRSEAFLSCCGAHLQSLSFMTTQITEQGTIVPSCSFDSVPKTTPGPSHAPLCKPVFFVPESFPTPSLQMKTRSPGM